jgi:hypothetical protein
VLDLPPGGHDVSYYLPNEPEVLTARLPLDQAQAGFGGVVDELLDGRYDCAWFGTSVLRERGWFALVDPDGPLADHVGDVLRLTSTDGRVTVYAAGSVRSGPTIAVTRQAYARLALLSTPSTPVSIEVLA